MLRFLSSDADKVEAELKDYHHSALKAKRQKRLNKQLLVLLNSFAYKLCGCDLDVPAKETLSVSET